VSADDGIFVHARDIAAPPAAVFAAFTDSRRLARWWGPAGFRNTFELCEFAPGGRWKYLMHGPDGHDYPNESVFEAVEPGRVVIHHLSTPRYRLTITLTASPAGTTVSWTQAFESARMGSRLASIVVPGNEQNLDRLAAEVAGGGR
jgi:uncharacterized protein YndB with AHSA1/START domain